MMKQKFAAEAITEESPKWEQCIERESFLEERIDEIRSKFWRDYNRLLHSQAYRRLKHKTQVFHATHNDHICTRIEHVGHVSSVSYTICDYLGLNKELAQAIAIGHDIGHAPFGHDGEHKLNQLAKKYYGGNFWHEKNSLHFADSIETLFNPDGYHRNLCLTYAVRDGIISHCGEVNEKVLFPRAEAIDLKTINGSNQHAPYTWEGCVVKIADKISYLGRDIEDALRLKILSNVEIEELLSILNPVSGITFEQINNTVLMHNFILDLCHFSSPEKGIGFSEEFHKAIIKIKSFNYKHIYLHPRLNNYNHYADLILTSIFELFNALFDENIPVLVKNIATQKTIYPIITEHFEKWLILYSNYAPQIRSEQKYLNRIIYDITRSVDYSKSIIDFISSLSDNFAIESYQEIIRF